MAWLRIDDGFMENPKIESLTAHELQVWMRVLCRGARQRSGELAAASVRSVAGLTSVRLLRFTELGLLDRSADGYEIHDWHVYNPSDPSNAVRQRRHRDKKRIAAEAHGLVAAAIKVGKLVRQPCEVCGSTSHVVAHHEDYAKPLEVVWLCRVHHAERHAEVTDDVTAGVTEESVPVTAPRARASTRDAHSRARAARPVPVEQEPLLHPSPRDAARTNGRTDGDPERINPHDELDRARRHA